MSLPCVLTEQQSGVLVLDHSAAVDTVEVDSDNAEQKGARFLSRR